MFLCTMGIHARRNGDVSKAPKTVRVLKMVRTEILKVFHRRKSQISLFFSIG